MEKISHKTNCNECNRNYGYSRSMLDFDEAEQEWMLDYYEAQDFTREEKHEMEDYWLICQDDPCEVELDKLLVF